MVNPIVLQPAAIFAGDFRVLRPLSQGGMGTVYVVEQISTGKQRALKLMLPQLVADPTLRKRFEQEARVGALIESEHVVEVVGAGIDTATNMPWLAMELLSGEDLSQFIAARGALNARDTLSIFEQLCHAVGAAHRAGIVHRDLKPENIFLARARRVGGEFVVKVLDFGIAKIAAEAKTARTAAIGSPMWMAPEQTDRSKISSATDVWALGLIAFHLLSGRYFWASANLEDTSVTELLREILLAPIGPASQRARELDARLSLPPGFDEWFARCVTREPLARFQNADEAMASLRPILAQAPQSPEPGGLGTPARTQIPKPTAPMATTLAPIAGPLGPVQSTSTPYFSQTARPSQAPPGARTQIASATALAAAERASQASAALAQLVPPYPGHARKSTSKAGIWLVALIGLVAIAIAFVAVRRRSSPSPSASPSSSAVAAELADQSTARVPTSLRDPQWGSEDAPVTVVVFSDFQCPFCGRVQATLKQIRETYGPAQVRMVWKNYPLPFHPKARPAAEAAMAVFALKGNEAFWNFHDRAFANQADLSSENYEKWALEAGIDAVAFKKELAAPNGGAKIDEDAALAAKVGVNGAPGFRINGVTVSGAQPFEKFKEVIDAQLAEASKLIASGSRASDVYVTLTNKNAVAAVASAAKPDVPEEEDKNVWKVPVLEDDPVRGPDDALVTIVQFSDYQCPFCKRVETTLSQVMQTYGNDVRIVWKDNPLPFHTRAKPAATLARLAYRRGGNKSFWSAHDLLFESNPKLEDADLKGIADKVGVSWDEAKRAFDAAKFADKFESNLELATDLQANGTPHFFINGVRLSGAQPFEKFKSAIDEQLVKAKEVVARGVPRFQVYEEIMKDGKQAQPRLPEKKDVAAPDASDPSRGGAGAKVVIQQFSDFQCPFCKRVEPTISALEAKYGNRIRVVWRDLPLPFHKNAHLAAEAGREVFAQKGAAAFWAFHDALFTADGSDEARTGRANLETSAQAQGVDMVRFRAALDAGTRKAKVDANAALAAKAGINGTPAFVINGYYLSGAQPEAAFSKIIDLALREAGGN
ncbi:MAG: thioredoxin domain-containing protein [Pseudomonadota bacterium]